MNHNRSRAQHGHSKLHVTSQQEKDYKYKAKSNAYWKLSIIHSMVSDTKEGRPHHSRNVQDGRLQHTEHLRILGRFRPAHRLPPVMLIGLFFSGIAELPHFIVRNTSENEEKPSEDAWFCSDGNVHRGGNSARREEAVGNILVSRKSGKVIADVGE